MNSFFQKIVFLFVFLTVGFGAGAFAAGAPGQVYLEECSACHTAYPPVFLPQKSWDQLLLHLDHHFGQNAELIDSGTLQSLQLFLSKNNFDHSRIRQRYGSRFDTLGTPLRVTETRFFQAIHHEIPDRYVTQNPKVKTFARCAACHQGADQGNFDERGIRIPR